jgi:hypothetical protein
VTVDLHEWFWDIDNPKTGLCWTLLDFAGLANDVILTVIVRRTIRRRMMLRQAL